MDVKGLIEAYLRVTHRDGLCNPEIECGCTIKDLFPCGGEGILDCQVAVKHKYNEEDEICKTCTMDCAKKPSSSCMRVMEDKNGASA